MSARDPHPALAPTQAVAAPPWQALLEALACGVLVHDPEGRLVDCNPAAQVLLGRGRPALMAVGVVEGCGLPVDAAGQPLPADQHPVLKTLHTGTPVDAGRLGVDLPGGDRRWLDIHTRLLPWQGRAWVVSCLMAAPPTVAAPQAPPPTGSPPEPALVPALEAVDAIGPSGELAASRTLAMLKGLFELMPVGISLMDMTTGRAVDVNDALCTMLGYSRDEMLTMDLGVCTPPDLRAARRQMFERALDLGHCGTYESVLLHRSGRPVHVLRSGARIVSPDGRPHVWSVAQDITARKALEQHMHAAATLDRLTGLPNRATLMHELAQRSQRACAEPGAAFAVLFFDFDRFKVVNDTLGHAAGDQLLCAVASRLHETLAGPDSGLHGACVARFGGDEFVALVPGLATPDAARQLGAQLRERLSRPCQVAGRELRTSASIGVAFSRGEHTVADDLLREADTAMYQAKRAARGSLVVFDEAMREQIGRAVAIEAALHGAVQRGEMRVVYQPIVDLDSAQLASVEALLRWRHPVLGAVSPNEFIPQAEESGDILALGEWVLRQACHQWARWQQADPQRAPRSVSVNLSRLQLTLGDELLRTVRAALDEAGMPAAGLTLEVTEREVARASTDTHALLHSLRALGVRLAMDDFGTGASSLAFLREMPFHAVKIDKSFVTGMCRDPHVLAVAHATVQLVGNLGMVSVAEGVEDPAELAALQSLGCQYGQGYLFGPPVAGDELLAAAPAAPG